MLDFILELLICILLAGCIIFGALYFRRWWQDNEGERRHGATKLALSRGQADYEPGRDVQAHARENLKFAGVPDSEAGDVLYNVPRLDPEAEGGWEANQPIVTTSRIIQLTKDGPVDLELLELMANGYVLLVKGPKVFLLKRYKPTASQERYLQEQRQDAADKHDGVIEDFLGKPWTIKMATGDSFTKGVGPAHSTIEVLSTHPRLGEEGLLTVLPPEVMDRKPHNYYDLEAVADDGQVLVAFYCKGGWVCLIGRQLDQDEIGSLHG